MSRIGKAPIVLPAGVTVSVSDSNLVTVTGPKGTLTEQITGNVKLTLVENEGKKEILLVAGDDKAETNAKHGLYRALVANMVTGVSEGFKKSVVINGVGYKVTKTGNKVVLNIGLSHPVEVVETEDVKLDCPSATEIVVSGINKEKVGQFAAMLRGIKPVEPYHAYGIKYGDEVVIKKVGKVSGKK